MRSKTTLIFFLLTLGLLAAFFAPAFPRAFWSTLFLSELLNFESKGWLGKWTPPPRIKEVSYNGPNGPVMADLYLPQPERPYPGILLNHGVVDTGKNDPRLRRFAGILCRSGFVVLVPDFKGMRSFRIAPSDVDEVQVAFENLISRGKHILPESCGLFGFSYGSGPTMIAASRPNIREKVRFVVSFGGYYDLKNVLSYIATGNFEFQGKRYFRKPQEYGKWVFLENNLDLIPSAQDRLILQRILQIKLKDERASIEQFLPLLGEEGKNTLALLSHSNPDETESLVQKLPSEVRGSIEALSVASALKRLKADLILAHGEDDDMIPYTETLRLAQAAPDPRRVYLQILKSYAHVDPDRQPLTLKNFFTFHLPEGWKLFGLINQLMKYRQAD
jgi:dienelactone hydrolase